MEKRPAADGLNTAATVNVRCNLCGADDYTVIYNPTIANIPPTVEDYTSTINRYGRFHRLVSCRQCGLVYMNPRDAGIKDLYKKVVDNAYLESWEERVITFKGHLKELAEHKAGRGNLLDIGCYAGIFLSEAKKDGYNVTGIELSEWAAGYAGRKTGAEVLCGSWDEVSLPESSFDAVTMWDVVEHLEDPSACFKKIHSWLKKDGIVAVTTHNIKGRFARLMAKRYLWLMRFHIYHFEPKTLSAILAKNGFELISEKPYVKTISLKYMLGQAGIKIPWRFLEKARFSFDTGDLFMIIARKK